MDWNLFVMAICLGGVVGLMGLWAAVYLLGDIHCVTNASRARLPEETGKPNLAKRHAEPFC